MIKDRIPSTVALGLVLSFALLEGSFILGILDFGEDTFLLASRRVTCSRNFDG